MNKYKDEEEIDHELINLLLEELTVWRGGAGIVNGVRKARYFEFVDYFSEKHKEKSVVDVIKTFNLILENNGLETISRSGYYKWKNCKTDIADNEIELLRSRLNNTPKLFRIEINLEIKDDERGIIEEVFDDIECGNTDFEYRRIPPKEYLVARYVYYRLSKHGGFSNLDTLRRVFGDSDEESAPDIRELLDLVRSQLDLYLDSFFQEKLRQEGPVLTISKDNSDRLISEIISHIADEIG